MDKESAAAFSAHACAVYAGICYPDREEDALEYWGQGCYELRYWVGEVAYAIFTLEEILWKRTEDFPGVFTYEVAEPVGQYIFACLKHQYTTLGEDWHLRDFGNWPNETARLVREFFEQGPVANMPVVEEVLTSWLAKHESFAIT